MTEPLILATDGAVATVTLNRPEKRNAMSRAMLDGLRRTFDALDLDPGVRVVVVRGAGPAFCSGMDLREMDAAPAAGADPESGVTEVLRRIERARHPTIAMINGDALAGGCELALHCDLRIAADAARLGMPLARIGLIVPFVLGQKLVEIAGPASTRELLFTGRPVSAARAREMGMVHQVVPAAELEAATYALARGIAENAPLSLIGMKAAILRAVALRETIDHRDLDETARQARQSADAHEGRLAMLEKRKPQFRGR